MLRGRNCQRDLTAQSNNKVKVFNMKLSCCLLELILAVIDTCEYEGRSVSFVDKIRCDKAAFRCNT